MTKEHHREKEIAREMGDCVHFPGIQHAECRAGVNMRQLVGGPDFGWAARLPCLQMDAAKCEVTCPSRKFPTREEAEAELAEHDARMEKFLISMRAAKDHAKQLGLGRGNGGQGRLACPSGCGGELRYSVASVNGHMHAACSTKGCVSWME